MSELRVATEYTPLTDPFEFAPLRELARRTNQDPSNLSKYWHGKLVLSQDLYVRLLQAAGDYKQESKR